MSLRRLLPPGHDVSFGSDGRDAGELDSLYATPSPNWVRINLVSSVDGNAVGSDGTSQTLTGGLDRRILGAIRRASDVVIVGAASVRAEGYQLPKSTSLAIVTATGNLSGHRFSGDYEAGRLLVLCPAAVESDAHDALPTAEVVVVADSSGRMQPADLLSALRSRGHRSITCEGGPSLAGQLLASGLVDEICLTTSPLITGVTTPLFGVEGLTPQGLRLEQLLADDDHYQFARWLVHH